MTRREPAISSAGGSSPAPTPTGFVSFVGAGPGDPGLLTMRAVELLRQADVVITELPAHQKMVEDLLGPEAVEQRGLSFVDAGVATDGELLADSLRAKIVARHGRHSRVVRLLSGDPFAFASGPEEAQACVKAGIGFEIVPGVSAIAAVPAYAGIPITGPAHGEVVVITRPQQLDAQRYLETPTLVVMGGAALTEVITRLLASGRDPQTPVAVTSAGSTVQQTTTVSTLAQVAADTRGSGLAADVVSVIGEVVELRNQLSWFESKPLFGWRVLVPRTKEQSGAVVAQLREYGAVPEEVPTISVEPPRNPQQMDKALRGLVEGRYEWVAFTSTNAVRAVREKLEEYGLDARAFSGMKLAAVGEKTAEALSQWGLRADLVPVNDQSATGLLEVFPEFDADLDPINRVFLPRADIATETLVAGLVELGWECEEVTAYRTVRASPPPAPIRDAIKSGQFDAVLFTSSSTVRNLVGIAGKPHTTTVIAVIGAATAKTAQEHGLRVDVVAARPDVEALVEALAAFGSARRDQQIALGHPVTRPSRRVGTRRQTRR